MDQANDSKQQWKTVKDLLHTSTNNSGTSRQPEECLNFCKIMAEYFRDKIIKIKTAIANQLAGLPINPFSSDKDHTGDCLSNLPSVTHDEVQRILNSMPQKSSPMDFMPTSLLKSCADIFVPIICRLANLSFAEGHFPRIFKTAQVTPLIKKPGMDPDAPGSYRPISNLNTVSKILEKLFATTSSSSSSSSSSL